MKHVTVILVSFLLLSRCADNGSLPYYTGDGRPVLAPCPDTGDAFAAWQCQRFYANQRINGYCLTVPGGEMGIRQCQQYYTRLAEQPPSPSTARVPRPEPIPSVSPAPATVPQFAGREAIYIGGTIGPDEDEDFTRRSAGLHTPLIILSGPGGNTLAAIKIGRIVRMRGWDTLVPEGQSCMSACALAWLGGTHRYMGISSKIGFHASYRMEGDKAVESGVGNAVVGAYLNSLGLPEPAVVYLTMSGPNDIQILNFRDANALGIRVSILGD